MKINYQRISQISFGFFISFFVALFTSFRDFSIGADTRVYVHHFLRMIEQGVYSFEPGFSIFMGLIGVFSHEPRVFLFAVSLLITFLLYYFYFCYFSKVKNKFLGVSQILVFYSLLFFSSWYLVAFSNGIRQGLSLSFLYISMYFFFFESKKIKASLFFLISISFHFSSILVIPFLVFYFLSFKIFVFFWLTVASFYPLGVNELLVKFISDKFSLKLYEKVKYYSIDHESLGTGRYEGFDVNFFIYTVFWPLLAYFSFLFFRNKSKGVDAEYFILVKVYMLLAMPYFVFGFGPFSNRYAFIAWLFVPIFQAILVSYFFPLNKIYFFVFCFFIFLVSLFFLLLVRLDFWSYII